MWHFLTNPITWLTVFCLGSMISLHHKQRQINQLKKTVEIQSKAILELRDDVLNNTRVINHNADLTNSINKIVVNKLHDLDQRQGD